VQVRAERPFVLVVGASGSGKSSLVRAGVLPLLTQPETIEGVGLWRWSITRPGAGGSGGECFDALAAALLESPALPGLRDPESRNAVGVLVDIAIGLYKREQVSLGRAAEIANMSSPAFLNELGRRKIPINYEINDFGS